MKGQAHWWQNCYAAAECVSTPVRWEFTISASELVQNTEREQCAYHLGNIQSGLASYFSLLFVTPHLPQQLLPMQVPQVCGNAAF